MNWILEVSSVFKSYGPLPVLKNLSVQVEEGEIFAIIGPNGAGKTTLFKVMTGEAPADAGEIVLSGENVTTLPAHLRVRKGMGRTFQVAHVFREFSVLENIELAIEMRRRNAGETLGPILRVKPSNEVAEEARTLLQNFRLDHLRERRAGLISHGDKKRLEFLIALTLRPKILMLDEPTAGMSPSDRIAIGRMIGEFRKMHGITVVMTEHDMDIVFGLADRIMVLNYGEVVAIGSVADVRNNDAVKEVYLGREIYDA